ncbi:hypothetical protein PUN28_016591 [Cardiocondyla obscurior]|uniref:Uncharacterized protein n=1 Tax=Cardiocondyla obscurior TaxID=286306 RepID=A0AAW2EMS9_9HYME
MKENCETARGLLLRPRRKRAPQVKFLICENANRKCTKKKKKKKSKKNK